MFVEGVAGSGKTSAALGRTKMLCDFNANSVFEEAEFREVARHSIAVLADHGASRLLLAIPARWMVRLSAHEVRQVKVSPVHRAQGSEAPVVLFDPADGGNPFLLTDEAKRLINVALSRAQAKIVVVVSPGDSANPIISQIINRARLRADGRDAVPIAELIRRAGFPACAVGQRVSIGRHTGEVARVPADGGTLWMINADTGAEQAFDVATLRKNAASAATS